MLLNVFVNSRLSNMNLIAISPLLIRASALKGL
jgi:hypothetical protein